MRTDLRDALLDDLRCEASPLYRGVVVFPDCRHAPIQRSLVSVAENHGNAGVDQGHGDAAAHGARANDRGLADFQRARVLRNVGNFRDTALREEGMDQRSGFIRGEAAVRNFFLFRETLFPRKRRSGLDGFDSGEGRFHIAPNLRRLLTACGIDRRVGFRRSELLDAVAGPLVGTAIRHLACKSDGAAAEISFDDPIDQAKAKGLRRLDRLSGNAHIHGSGDTDQSRQTLRSLSARDDAEIHFGLSHLRFGRCNAIVRRHGQFHAAPQCGAVKRNDYRPGKVFDRLQQGMQVEPPAFTPSRLFEELDVRAGNERAPGGGDQHGFYRRILAQEIKRADQTFIDILAYGVYRRVINDNDGDIRGIGWPLEPDDVVHAHRSLTQTGRFRAERLQVNSSDAD